jgi:2-polyprenyl-3-methyl-5-hydroxy-6-metoxy-1,4-benzoquinol methylase
MKYQNTKKVWDTFWQSTTFSNRELLKEESKTIRWKRIRQYLSSQLKSLKNFETIEVGAGMGTYSALLAKKGAKTTLLDYSDSALEYAKKFFKDNGLKATLLKDDALRLPKKLYGRYDVALSFGLIEHFKGKERKQIIKSHLDLVRKNGLIIISVPNRHCLPYRIYKYGMELIGRWPYGLEIPYSRNELTEILKKLGVKEIVFTGDSFFWSLNFINPLLFINRKLKINNNQGTFLDPFLSFSLVVMAKK